MFCVVNKNKNLEWYILRDNLLVNAALGFNTTNLIQAQSKVNFNGDTKVGVGDGARLLVCGSIRAASPRACGAR